MIHACMNCGGWGEAKSEHLPGLCIACGASGNEQKAFENHRVYVEFLANDPEVNKHWLISRIGGLNQNGEYTYKDVLEKLGAGLCRAKHHKESRYQQSWDFLKDGLCSICRISGVKE